MLRRLPSVFRQQLSPCFTRPTPRFFSRATSNAPKASQNLNTKTFRITRGSYVSFTVCTAIAVSAIIYTQAPVLLDAGVASTDPIRIDPDTKLEFPETLVIPSKIRLPPYTLLGLGVRTVSFLGIKVYSVGFYADLTNQSLKLPENATVEEKVDYLVSNTSCVLRIIPTRSTSYTHLRDGFIRALQGRMSAQLKTSELSPEIAEDAQSPLRKLKSVFPNSPLAKGTPLDIVLSAPPKSGEKRTLVVRDLGLVENDWVAKEFFMAYFEGQGLSPPMKKSVAVFLEGPLNPK